jgi:hypothetical protein
MDDSFGFQTVSRQYNHRPKHDPKVKTRNEDINITINGERLEIVKKTKFLGLILDNQLQWKDHITYTSQKVAKSLGILSIANRVLNKKSMLQLYYALIYPYLYYGNSIWGKSFQSTFWPVYRQQKWAIRILTNTKRYQSTLEPSRTLKILRLPEINKFTIGIFMFKHHNKMLPDVINRLFTSSNVIHKYNTRNANELRISMVRTQTAENFITKNGVKIWNNLKTKIKTETSLKNFKKLWKICLLG